MKTYQQQTQSILRKADKKRRKRGIALGVTTALGSIAATALALVLFLPYPISTQNIAIYQDSAYYPVIQKINDIKGMPMNGAPMYKNNFEKWTAWLGELFSLGSAFDNAAPMAPGVSWDEWREEETGDADTALGDGEGSAAGGNGDYVETTDNQVKGVVEADLLKRSENYAFYLTPSYYDSVWNEDHGYYETTRYKDTLRAYSIAGSSSTLVGEYEILPEKENFHFRHNFEMYLTQDCETLIVVGSGYTTKSYGNGEDKWGPEKQYVTVIALDVSDPTRIREIDRTYLTGYYVSSRLVNGKLLMITSSYLTVVDYDDESTFVPQYGALDAMQSVAAEDILCSDVATSAKYTVVTKLDEKTLTVEDSVALLSYTNEVTVSETNLFLTQGYVEKTEADGVWNQISKTEIACVNYAGEGLEFKGTFTVDGTVKNQYSMDEYENALRVVTTYRKWTSEKERPSWWRNLQTNANLYCIDLTSFETIAKVEQFAPDGETVESVRFNGTKAYVCTAEVITVTDPVFFFDLSDLSNITYTDTGIIDGYSSSLVDFGHGYLVGIGLNEMRQLKIEVYAQGEGVVNIVDTYEMDAVFSREYKSYLIDKEHGLVGLGVQTYLSEEMTTVTFYLLLKIENGEVCKEYLIPRTGVGFLDETRAFYEDGYLYLFGKEFQAVNIG